ncbi:MAG TPA: hypothetical protein VGL59_14070 [Polyangia bacterium]|jgi:AmiR/NasT family two-component response regulator
MADVVTLISDMLFSSKVREAAKATGVSVQSTRDVPALVSAARAAKLVVIDLRLPIALDALDAVAADPEKGPATIVGFIDHEKTDVMDQARAKGCAQVMAKGQFANALPKLLTSLRA